MPARLVMKLRGDAVAASTAEVDLRLPDARIRQCSLAATRRTPPPTASPSSALLPGAVALVGVVLDL